MTGRSLPSSRAAASAVVVLFLLVVLVAAFWVSEPLPAAPGAPAPTGAAAVVVGT